MDAMKDAPRKCQQDVPCRVLIVDDHELLRAGLRAMIAGEFDLTLCGEATGLSDALDQIRELQPEIAIIDLVLRSGDGLELIRRVREQFPSVRVIGFSMYGEELYGERALRAGANGYVCKQEPARAILDCIRKVCQGKPHFSDDLMQRVMNRARGRASGAMQSPIESLSDRELEVFRRIGQGLPTVEIAKQLNLSRSTIDTYRERLKSKLGLINGNGLTRQATLWVVENG